jgi:hypothetical protein
MIEVELPDGTVERFPDFWTDAEIAATLRAKYPARLDPGQVCVRENGATIEFDQRLDRYVVRDHAGNARAYRDKLADAIKLADSLARPTARTPRRRYHVEAVPVPRQMVQPQPVTTQAAAQIEFDVERHIEAQETKRYRAAIAERKNRRSRNYGTTHR